MNLSINNYTMAGIYKNYSSSGLVKNNSFSEAIGENGGTGVRAAAQSTVDDYLRRHPSDKAQIDRLLDPGLKVMEQYGRSDTEIEKMSMDEYKSYIYGILDKLPYDSSQLRDIQFIDITEKGWEQMKNDPKYEAWVVGYFKVDRSVKLPFANYPGVEPRIHTEHFGATIDEHIGQSYPQSMSTGSEKDSESWWKKRHKRHEQFMEQAQELADKKRLMQKSYAAKVYESLAAKGSGNTYFDFGMNMMSPAAEFFLMMAGGKNVFSDN